MYLPGARKWVRGELFIGFGVSDLKDQRVLEKFFPENVKIVNTTKL